MSIQNRQQGGSAIGPIIILAILAYGIFVGIQYVPQYIESSNVKTILESVVEKHDKQHLGDMGAVQKAIDNQLYINQMNDLKNNFKVTTSQGYFVITVRYERELNLLYANKLISYEKSVTLE